MASMTTLNSIVKETKEVMQTHLPLVFANGSPISLESMNLVSDHAETLLVTNFGLWHFNKVFLLFTRIYGRLRRPMRGLRRAARFARLHPHRSLRSPPSVE